MKPVKIKERAKVIRTFYTNCPICKKEIKGNSKSHVVINLRFHMDKHDRDKEVKKK